MLKKGIVKEMIERMERQDNSTLKLTNSKETLRKKLDIEKEKAMIRKEKENDGIKLEPNLLSNFIHNNMVQQDLNPTVMKLLQPPKIHFE